MAAAAAGGQSKKHVQITFDEQNRIRLLDESAFKDSEQLANECQAFTDKIDQFSKTVAGLVDVLSQQSAKIEKEKLMAIGQRNRILTETETRKRKQQELQIQLLQKQQQLQRIMDQYESLVRVETEQRALIDKLSKN